MAISTAGVIVVSVLGCCLVITSAVLIYKLRPNRTRLSERKCSRPTSELASPVRKMVLVRGRLVEENTQKPSRAFLPRLSALYTSRRASTISSTRLKGPTAHTIDDVEASIDSTGDTELSPMHFDGALDYERHRRSRKHRASAMLLSKHTAVSQHPRSSGEPILSSEILSLRSPASTNGHRSNVSRDLTSESMKPADGKRNSEPVNVKINELATKSRPSFDTSFLRAASISAEPGTAYNSVPSPKPQISPPAQVEVDYNTQSILNLGSSPTSESKSSRESEYRVNRTTSRDLEMSTNDPTYSPTSTRKFTTSEKSISKPARSRSRSRSDSDKSKDKSKTHRGSKRRPPPIQVNTPESRPTPAPVESQRLQKETGKTPGPEVENPRTTTPEPVTPPILSSNIVDFTRSHPFFTPPRAVPDRQSMATIASSQYSPTFSLVSAQQMPLYAGKVRPMVELDSAPPMPPLPTFSSAQPSNSTSRNLPTSTIAQISAAAVKSPTSRSERQASTPHTPVTATASRPPSSRRPNHYSYITDKDLPAPPPTASQEVNHERKHKHKQSGSKTHARVISQPTLATYSPPAPPSAPSTSYFDLTLTTPPRHSHAGDRSYIVSPLQTPETRGKRRVRADSLSQSPGQMQVHGQRERAPSTVTMQSLSTSTGQPVSPLSQVFPIEVMLDLEEEETRGQAGGQVAWNRGVFGR